MSVKLQIPKFKGPVKRPDINRIDNKYWNAVLKSWDLSMVRGNRRIEPKETG